METPETQQPSPDNLRTGLMKLVWIPVGFGILHHADHVIRAHGAPGLPFGPHVSPFTYSLVIYPLVLIGFVFALRGRLMAWYWLLIAIAGFAISAPTHIGPYAE